MRNLEPGHEQKCHEMRSEFGRQCVQKLRDSKHPRAEEYINEFEHQDGCECWDEYFEGDLREMWSDFRLYVENSA